MDEVLEIGSQEEHKTGIVLTDEWYLCVEYQFLVLFPNLVGRWSEKSLSTKQKFLACSVFQNVIYWNALNRHADWHIARL